MTWLFILLAALVIVATGLALAGRWRPEGLSTLPPQEPRRHEGPPFDVALRGYRMDQVDAELERLHHLLQAAAEDESAEPPSPADAADAGHDAASPAIEP
jgi:uncharacterized iron-regulated membrane protein